MATRRSTRVTQLDLLNEISQTTEDFKKLKLRRNLLIKRAFEEGINRSDIAAVADISRDGVYKLMEDKPWLQEEAPE